MISDFQVQKTLRAQEQVSEHVRQMIRSGQFVSGTKLPSTQELAIRWKTHASTVHAALIPLVKQGLLARCHGKGTFVCKREERLTCAGIYLAEDIWTKETASFQRSVHARLKQYLNEMGIQTRTWIDPRPSAENIHPWPELVRAAEHREIQAVFTTAGGWFLPWINKLPIPSAHCTSTDIPNRVGTDPFQLADLSLHALAEQGGRSVGLICPIPAAHRDVPQQRPRALDEFFAHFIDTSRDLGLVLKNEWVRTPPHEHFLDGVTEECFGRDEFLRLWSQTEKPDGLVVFTDWAAKGVILGLLEKQVQVPHDLKLVLYKNAGVELLCPVPAAFIVMDEREVARALFRLVEQQLNGEAIAPILVPVSRWDAPGSGSRLTKGSP